MADTKKKKEKRKPSRDENITAIIAAAAAVGLFLLSMFVPKEQLKGNGGWHWVQIGLTVIATVAALILAQLAMKERRLRKNK